MFKFKAVKLKLSSILWLIFLLIVLGEGVVLYKYLYLNLQNIANEQYILDQSSSLQINKKVNKELKEWLGVREGNQIHQYSLRQGSLGRENPFEEYEK